MKTSLPTPELDFESSSKITGTFDNQSIADKQMPMLNLSSIILIAT
ncbi:MAG: hypothetical protein IPO85_18645 [Saprospiraceae bacterium]|uniref:Uncharacterized protein n=1 Tax=Candidatus Defluviibacterium haderslevense TaxID=2981993 RepID=A0A9D7SBS0_9BACT|nr:hypothetical protein [Candidatus Defluviibacterium haderslevense]